MDSRVKGDTISVVTVDDDEVFRAQLVRALEARGHEAFATGDGEEAIRHIARAGCDLCILDLRMPVDGLTWIPGLREALGPDGVLVLLTGYGSIATAVEAMRLGADDYLTKPADVDQILAAYQSLRARAPEPPPPDYPVASLDRLEWEHIQRVLRECDGNVTHAARRLGLHRQSLQRKLRNPPSD